MFSEKPHSSSKVKTKLSTIRTQLEELEADALEVMMQISKTGLVIRNARSEKLLNINYEVCQKVEALERSGIVEISVLKCCCLGIAATTA